MHARWMRLLTLLIALAANGIGVRRSSADDAGDALPPPPPIRPATGLSDAALAPEQRAELAFLEHLGWRPVVDPSVATITVAAGTPCRRANLEQARAAGDLRILVPPAVGSLDVARFGASLSELADSIPSRCAWQFRVAAAVERATSRLSANAVCGNWRFPKWAGLNAPIFSMAPPTSEWVRRKRIWVARGKPSAAVEAFYDQRASTECYVGQTIAAYAIQYEIYGASWFDAVFTPDEIAIGQVDDFHRTPIGKTMDAPAGYPWRALFLRPEDAGEDKGAVLGRLGPMAWPGVTGILMDQNGTGLSNQNLTVVSVSAAAASWFASRGGLGAFGARTQELLAIDRAKRAPFVTGADLTAGRVREDAILAEPVFREIRVYIHPYGVVPLGEVVDKMRRRDHTALELILYDEAREDTFYERYRKAWKDRFRAGMTGR